MPNVGGDTRCPAQRARDPCASSHIQQRRHRCHICQEHASPKRKRIIKRRPDGPFSRRRTRQEGLRRVGSLTAGLRRLKLARIRALATAKMQRWSPEEVLRTLVAAEIEARDASNAANRLKAAAFPVHKSLEAFDVAASSIPGATFAYLATLEWVRARANLALVGPAGTGKSHILIGL